MRVLGSATPTTLTSLTRMRPACAEIHGAAVAPGGATSLVLGAGLEVGGGTTGR